MFTIIAFAFAMVFFTGLSVKASDVVEMDVGFGPTIDMLIW